MCNFIAKAVLGVTFMIWLRWTLPRLRIDQVMTTCLKYCVPLASAMLAGAMVWTYLFPGGSDLTEHVSNERRSTGTVVSSCCSRCWPARRPWRWW